MPSVSVGGDYVGSSYATSAELARIPTAGLRDGDQAYCTTPNQYWRLNKSSTMPVGAYAAYADIALSDPAKAGRWILIGSGTILGEVVNAAALVGVSTAGLPLGAQIWIDSYRTWARLDTTANAGAAVADKVFASDSASFKWVRMATPLGAWDFTYATEVYVNETTGNNENDGTTSGTALRSVEEVGNRIPYLDHDLTIRVGSNLSGVTLNMTPRTRARITLSMRDGATVFATGTAAVVGNPNPAGNATGTITATGIANWVASVGKIIEADGGTGIGTLCYSFVLADSAGTGLIPKFCQYSLSSIPGLFLSQGVGANPAANVRVLTLAQITGTIVVNVGQGTFITLAVDRTPAGSANPAFSGAGLYEVASLFSSPWITTTTASAMQKNWISSGIPAGATYNAQAGLWSIVGGGCLGNIAMTTPLTVFAFGGFIIYGGSIWAGNFAPAAQTETICINLFSGGNFAQGLGVFNAAVVANSNPSGDGVVLWANAQISCGAATAALYGSGNTGRGLSIQQTRSGAIIANGYTPTITGTGGDIRWQGLATAIPPLTAGAAVPAASALTTWAQWAAAPFNRQVTDYGTNCFLTGL